MLLHPGQRRVGRDVDVDDPPGADLHDDEDVGDGEEGGVLGEEVTGPNRLAVVADEGAPGLVPARGVATGNHVATNRAGGVLNPELGGKLLGDLVLAPFGMVTRDASDEVDALAGDARSADLARARPAPPQQLETLAMPCDDRVRLDDDQGTIPVRPKPSEESPEESIPDSKPRALLRSLVDGELLAQGRVLQGER